LRSDDRNLINHRYVRIDLRYICSHLRLAIPLLGLMAEKIQQRWCHTWVPYLTVSITRATRAQVC
jgi:hypothetical protein